MIWSYDLVSQCEANGMRSTRPSNGCCTPAATFSPPASAGLAWGLVPVVNTEAAIYGPGIAMMEASVPRVRDAAVRGLALPHPQIAVLGRRAVQSDHQLCAPERFRASVRDVIRRVTMSNAR